MRIFLLLVLMATILPTTFVQAQFFDGALGGELSIVLDPQYPGPRDEVTATLDDYSLNTSGTSIAWFIDQKFVVGSENKREISFTAGDVGTNTTIEVRLTDISGHVLATSQTVSPIYIDVIIEPQTYTPVFYAGRALPIYGSTVYLTALVGSNTNLTQANGYTFNWKLNDQVLGGGSMRGGNKTSLIVPHGSSNIITLSVFNNQGQTIARRLFEIPSVAIDVQFYEINTLYGLSHKAVGESLNLLSNSTTIKAVPYNLDLNSVNGNLFTEWQINGRGQKNTTADPFEITLQRRGGGSDNITFKVRNLSELLQGDETSFLLNS